MLINEWFGLHGMCVGNAMRNSDDFSELPKAALPIGELLDKGIVSIPECKSMVGNGWHAPSIGSFLMWLLSNIESKGVLRALHFQMSTSGDNIDVDSDGCHALVNRSQDDEDLQATQPCSESQFLVPEPDNQLGLDFTSPVKKRRLDLEDGSTPSAASTQQSTPSNASSPEYMDSSLLSFQSHLKFLSDTEVKQEPLVVTSLGEEFAKAEHEVIDLSLC